MAKQTLYAIIDVETTGMNARRDRITEVAVQLLREGEPIEHFTSLVNPGVAIPANITRITGITTEMVAEAPPFYEVARRLVEITEGAIFVAHNVRFDYSFIQQEFKRLGYNFTRRQLCTVKLTKKIFPGLPSYSLRNLCREFEIVNEASHRAWGDVAATTELFQILLNENGHYSDQDLLKAALDATRMPRHLPKEVVDNLPGTCGVYYFHNQKGDLLYVGKSTNIRKRVLSHFSAAHKTRKGMKMLTHVYDISYVETGSELVALLLENEEIKRFLPPLNSAQRFTKLKYGIFSRENGAGYLQFEVRSLGKHSHPIATYPEKRHAQSALEHRLHEYRLCLKYCGLGQCGETCLFHQMYRCEGAGMGAETPEAYNERAEAAFQHLKYGYKNFLVVGDGREYGERSVVWVKDGVYQGYGYVDMSYAHSTQDMLEAIELKPETPDVGRIIRGYIRKHPKEITEIDPTFS
ncbi:MAG: exonuclease domain-containing protein [Bacteroidota bacterium]